MQEDHCLFAYRYLSISPPPPPPPPLSLYQSSLCSVDLDRRVVETLDDLPALPKSDTLLSQLSEKIQEHSVNCPDLRDLPVSPKTAPSMVSPINHLRGWSHLRELWFVDFLMYNHVHWVHVPPGHTCVYIWYIHVHVHVHVYTKMFDEMRRKKERSKQGQTNKQGNKAKQHSTPKAVTFPRKNELPHTCTLYVLWYIWYIRACRPE